MAVRAAILFPQNLDPTADRARGRVTDKSAGHGSKAAPSTGRSMGTAEVRHPTRRTRAACLACQRQPAPPLASATAGRHGEPIQGSHDQLGGLKRFLPLQLTAWDGWSGTELWLVRIDGNALWLRAPVTFSRQHPAAIPLPTRNQVREQAKCAFPVGEAAAVSVRLKK